MKKYKKMIIIVSIITLIRFLISYKLPSFYIYNLVYDDRLMIHQLTSLLSGKYLGNYTDFTLIKGIVFPMFLFITKSIHMSYSSMLTILYILACMYFTKSLDKVIKEKKILLIIYAVLLFNPISFSSELFQRLYRNSLSSIELLFFLGVIIRIFLNDTFKKKDIINYIILGIIISLMRMTREDNIWTTVIIILLIGYKFIKNKNIKTILICLIPILVLNINLNIVSFINYKHYKIYTYNEIQKSSFKNTYKKVLEIKDDKKINKVSIPKSTLYLLSDETKTFNISRKKIDKYYDIMAGKNGEIYNGNIIWYFREYTYRNNKLSDGEKSEKYFKKLGKELDELYKDKKIKKEFAFSSILLNKPSMNDLKQLPKSTIDIVTYTTSYKNVKPITDFKDFKYNTKVKAYTIEHKNSHTTEKLVKVDDKDYEMIRIIYSLLTIVLSPISLVAYIINIRKKDNINLISHIVLISYLVILAGVSYTNVTAFPTVRYLCLGNLYILQSIFVILNIYRLYKEQEEKELEKTKKTTQRKKKKHIEK